MHFVFKETFVFDLEFVHISEIDLGDFAKSVFSEFFHEGSGALVRRCPTAFVEAHTIEGFQIFPDGKKASASQNGCGSDRNEIRFGFGLEGQSLLDLGDPFKMVVIGGSHAELVDDFKMAAHRIFCAG